MSRRHPGQPHFCLEMIEAAFIDSDFQHRVVTGDIDPDGTRKEWIEIDAQTALYTNEMDEQSLTVTIRVEDGAVQILAAGFYPPGSLHRSAKPKVQPDGSKQVLWLGHSRSDLVVELVENPTGQIDLRLCLQSTRPFNRADVPNFVRSFIAAADLVEQTVRDTGLRQDRRSI